LSIKDVKNNDLDLIKDGNISILVSSNNIIIYNGTESLEVEMGLKTKEQTNITNTILDFS